MAGLDNPPPKAASIVPTVVAHMMTPGVVQVPGDVSVSEAALMLEREQAPCLLVKDTETLFGLMTPTDIVKKVVAQGLEPHETEVRTIMSRPVQFIEYDEALEEASTLMVATGASLLIVTKQNQPVGVITAHDLMLTPPRRATNIPAVVTVMGHESAGGRQAHNAVILQLNHLGARMESETKVAVRSRVVLAFSLPGQNTPLTVHGKVLDSEFRPAGSAEPSGKRQRAEIQFIELPNADLARLKAWVLQTLPPSPRS